MDRGEILLRGIEKSMLGVEVGPYFNPLVPKREGFRSLSLDVYDRPRLLDNAERDPHLSVDQASRIEDVDLIGGATDIESLVEKKGYLGQIDYIISSHNFEHLPDPVRFLNGCAKALTPEGVLSMALPDRRATFDFFRPISTTADFLWAFHTKPERPNFAQIYDLSSSIAYRLVDGNRSPTWEFEEGGQDAFCPAEIEDVYGSLQQGSDRDDSYVDSHCFVFTKSSFELVIRDLHFLRIIDLGLDRLEGPCGCEFYARLRQGIPVPKPDEFRQRRNELLHQVIDECASNSRRLANLEKQIKEQQERIDELSARPRNIADLLLKLVRPTKGQ